MYAVNGILQIVNPSALLTRSFFTSLLAGAFLLSPASALAQNTSCLTSWEDQCDEQYLLDTEVCDDQMDAHDAFCQYSDFYCSFFCTPGAPGAACLGACATRLDDCVHSMYATYDTCMLTAYEAFNNCFVLGIGMCSLIIPVPATTPTPTPTAPAHFNGTGSGFFSGGGTPLGTINPSPGSTPTP